MALWRLITNSVVLFCVHGEWTEWTTDRGFACSVTCGVGVAAVVQRRNCSRPSYSHGGDPCAGDRLRISTDVCNTGTNCPRSSNTSTARPSFNERIPQGINIYREWSPWILKSTGICTSKCNKTMIFVRICTNPTPFSALLKCIGPSSAVLEIQCRGDDCKEGYVYNYQNGSDMMILLVIVNVIFGIVVIAFIFFLLRERRMYLKKDADKDRIYNKSKTDEPKTSSSLTSASENAQTEPRANNQSTSETGGQSPEITAEDNAAFSSSDDSFSPVTDG